MNHLDSAANMYSRQYATLDGSMAARFHVGLRNKSPRKSGATTILLLHAGANRKRMKKSRQQ